jgi:hypothetical protein
MWTNIVTKKKVEQEQASSASSPIPTAAEVMEAPHVVRFCSLGQLIHWTPHLITPGQVDYYHLSKATWPLVLACLPPLRNTLVHLEAECQLQQLFRSAL